MTASDWDSEPDEDRDWREDEADGYADAEDDDGPADGPVVFGSFDPPERRSPAAPRLGPLPAGPVVYLVKVLVKGVRPPVRRRLWVADGTLASVHPLLAAALGTPAAAALPYMFTGTDNDWADPSRDPEWDGDDARTVTLAELVAQDELFFEYTIDPDASAREHVVKIEKVALPQAGILYPVCVGGSGSLTDAAFDRSAVDIALALALAGATPPSP